MYYICESCVTDKELKEFIISEGKIGTCECHDKQDVHIIDIEELLDFFKELLDNFEPNARGTCLTSLIQNNWNLFCDSTRGKEILNYILNKIGSPISNSDELVVFSEEILENINYWNKLKEQLKWEQRYITDINYLIYDLGWDSFFESKLVLKSEDIFYRARLHKSADHPVFDNDDMFCPRKEYSTAGRANPIGIPYLYLSDNEVTILHEIRASFLDEISVASFSIRKDIKNEIIISDFTEIPPLYNPNGVNKTIKATLLKKLISTDLSKPMRRYDSELDYIPTQFICEFIKVFTSVHGIKFKSSLHATGNNLVIFNQENMNCLNVKKVRISNVNIKSINL